MKLISISVENYRSVTKAHRVPISDLTVLVGPNNEGKSNILRALVTAMEVLAEEVSRVGGKIPGYQYRSIYDWDTDFPIHLQESQSNGKSVILLDFLLSNEEQNEFWTEIKSRVKGNLPLRFELGQRSARVSVYKKGPGGPALTKKSQQIARFVGSRLEFDHVPAVRTAESARKIVSDLVSRELSRLEKHPEYVAALEKIEQLQTPILRELSASIKQTLVKFLPKVDDVDVQIPQRARYRGLRQSCEVTVDDGTPTLLEYKGDGVQSLAALALMRHAAETAARGKQLVIAIEEPESHLHSSAVHEIRGVLKDLASRHQVVITTHNPLFIDRSNPAANILVSKRRARPAKSIQEIRDTLGVRAADNLRHAELVLLCEGESDCVALAALLASASTAIAHALANGALAIDSLNGAHNLTYKAGVLRAALCNTHAALDDDASGHRAIEKVQTEGLLEPAHFHLFTCPGRKEAELEDLYRPESYESVLVNRFGVPPPSGKGRTKWTSRLQDHFKKNGKQWNDRVERDVKTAVARAIADAPSDVLIPQCKSAFDSLVSTLEQRLRHQ